MLDPFSLGSARKGSAEPLRKGGNRAVARFLKPSAGLEPATPSLPWQSSQVGGRGAESQSPCLRTEIRLRHPAAFIGRFRHPPVPRGYLGSGDTRALPRAESEAVATVRANTPTAGARHHRRDTVVYVGAVEHSAIRSSPTATRRAYCSARSLDTAVCLRVIQRSRRCRGPSHGRASLAASRQRGEAAGDGVGCEGDDRVGYGPKGRENSFLGPIGLGSTRQVKRCLLTVTGFRVPFLGVNAIAFEGRGAGAYATTPASGPFSASRRDWRTPRFVHTRNRKFRRTASLLARTSLSRSSASSRARGAGSWIRRW
jgi:hypothetical protein